MLALVANNVAYAPAVAGVQTVTRTASPQMFGKAELEGEQWPHPISPANRSRRFIR